jgi:hypothetical protein
MSPGVQPGPAGSAADSDHRGHGRAALYVVLLALMFLNPALRQLDKPMAAAGEPTAGEPPQLEPAPQARRAATMKAGL